MIYLYDILTDLLSELSTLLSVAVPTISARLRKRKMLKRLLSKVVIVLKSQKNLPVHISFIIVFYCGCCCICGLLAAGLSVQRLLFLNLQQ